MITSLLYVSRSTLKPIQEVPEIGSIVETARSRNRSLSVTGALVFARGHFAQVLEGDPAAVDELMFSIRRDARHTDLKVVNVLEVEERRYTKWSLAYAGPSTYVEHHIAPLLPAVQEAQGRSNSVDRLLQLMQEFTNNQEISGSAA